MTIQPAAPATLTALPSETTTAGAVAAPTLLSAEALSPDETGMATLWSLTASADCRRVAYLVQQGQQFFVVLDGQTREGPYQMVDLVQFSADGRHAVYPAMQDNLSFFVVDGQPGQPYDGVQTLTISTDGQHVAYVAMQGGQTLLVVDGQATPVAGELLEASRRYARYPQPAQQFNPAVVELSGDGQHVAYALKAGDAQFVVLDGQPGQPYSAIGGVSLQFSPDGQRLAYAAAGGGQQFVVVDGEEGQRYDAVDAASLKFSPESQHLAYVAYTGDQAFVVLDGQAGQPYLTVPAGRAPPAFGSGYFAWHDVLRFSPDSRRLAYIAATSEGQVLVVDGVASPPATRIGAFLFSPDSQHVAYVAERDDRDFVVIDGHESQPLGAQSAAIIFSPDSQHTAITAHKNGADLLLVDGQIRATERRIRAVVFRPDSQSVVYTAEAGAETDVAVAVVTQEGVGPRFNEIWCGPLFAAPDRFHYLAVNYGAPGVQMRTALQMEVYLVEDR